MKELGHKWIFNSLLTGPTGVGKSYSMEVVGHIINLMYNDWVFPTFSETIGRRTEFDQIVADGTSTNATISVNGRAVLNAIKNRLILQFTILSNRLKAK